MKAMPCQVVDSSGPREGGKMYIENDISGYK